PAPAAAATRTTKPTLSDLQEKDALRRVSHSAIERRRREKINDKIMQLRTLVPSCANQSGLHKLSILENAIEHIIHLQGLLAKQQQQQPAQCHTCPRHGAPQQPQQAFHHVPSPAYTPYGAPQHHLPPPPASTASPVPLPAPVKTEADDHSHHHVYPAPHYYPPAPQAAAPAPVPAPAAAPLASPTAGSGAEMLMMLSSAATARPLVSPAPSPEPRVTSPRAAPAAMSVNSLLC
ncbi:hypothetical protein HDU96_000792, partial [Phlyctochytrium bullatum]